jgi:hypothetical protein
MVEILMINDKFTAPALEDTEAPDTAASLALMMMNVVFYRL